MANVDIEKKSKSKIKEPVDYKVVILNDEHTPMVFVIAVLMSIFGHDDKTAEDLTQEIHEEGSAVAGIYQYEIAEQKGTDGTVAARNSGYPLQFKIEPA